MKRIVIVAMAVLAGAAQTAAGQTTGSDPSAATPQAATPAATTQPEPSDRAVDPSEPDFTLIGLPTTLRMPKFASAFRVTHRFTRPLG